MEFQTRIVGTHFQSAEAKNFATNLKQGDTLAILRDAANKFDVNAVQVLILHAGPAVLTYAEGVSRIGSEFPIEASCLGFIPKTDNSALAAELDSGIEYFAEVILDGQLFITVKPAPIR